VDGEPVTPTTKVDIASVSKQFTGVAVELLIDRGELSGADLVGELVPESSPATDDVTIDELLTHTSGIADYTELLPQEFDEPSTQGQAIEAISQSEPTGTRGSFEYSNSNYVLLAEVVESVTGSSFVDFLDTEIFEPLGLDMAVELPGPWKQVGDGSIWTTSTELVQWSSQYWDQTLEGPDLATVMFDPEVNASDEDGQTEDTYGSGIMRGPDKDGTEWFHHDGSWERYETDWVLIPDEELAAAVTCDVDAVLKGEEPARDLVELWRSSD
jgi:CubicO group peptidase (beta-lactamase class C family)